MNSGKILAEILLSFSILSTGFPEELNEIKNTLNNTSEFFMKPITIKKEDSISPVDFTDIFGKFDQDGNLEEYVPKKINRNTVNIRILPSSNSQTIILKIGEKSLVINPGGENLKISLIKTLGSMQISKLDTIIFSDIKSSPENMYSLIEMGMVNRIILPAVDLEPNANNVEILKNFSDIKSEIAKRGATYVEMKDNTKIQIDDCIITSVLPKNTSEASFIIDDEDTITFVQGELPIPAQSKIILPKINTYISKTNVLVSKDILSKISPGKIILTKFNEGEIPETYNNAVEKVGKENVLILNDQNGVDIVSPNAKEEELIVNGQSNNT